ncbi:MAG: glycogen/starch/alpha-glucan phosphorylase, partial [Lachnospiraceae bacterium]|nr:glycogen/starch/alpha-glucan phosphorylase [Lachnospiraceae bacterium]
VEIVEEVGEENAFIFGMSAQEVIDHERNGDYNPREIFDNDMEIRHVLLQLVNGYFSPDDHELFRPIYRSLLEDTPGRRADTFFILKDFRSYIDAQRRVDAAYRDREAWTRSAILNAAGSGKFSSDRTIEEYAQELWHLKKVTLPAPKAQQPRIPSIADLLRPRK